MPRQGVVDAELDPDRIAQTGIDGLDDILNGGLSRGRLYLIEGVPGSGKTTLAMQFLLEGARRGEPVLYITLSETRGGARERGRSHGWSLDGITIRELLPHEARARAEEQYTMFHPSEVELAETTQDDPRGRRALEPDARRVRLALGAAPAGGQPAALPPADPRAQAVSSPAACTVLLLDDLTATEHDLQVQSIAHGVILLEQLSPEYGAERRRLRVIKYRGSRFRGGYHDYHDPARRPGGLPAPGRGRAPAAPRCEEAPERHRRARRPAGRRHRGGTSTLIIGGAGTGQVDARRAVRRRPRRARRARRRCSSSTRVLNTLLTRCRGLGIDLAGARRRRAASRCSRSIRPSCRRASSRIRCARRSRSTGATIVVIDSLNGYLNAMPEEHFLIIQLHELLIVPAAVGRGDDPDRRAPGPDRAQMTSPVDASYLADAVILLRYFEARARCGRRSRSSRSAAASTSARSANSGWTHGGIRVGEPLRELPRRADRACPIYEGSATRRAVDERALTHSTLSAPDRTQCCVLLPTATRRGLTQRHPAQRASGIASTAWICDELPSAASSRGRGAAAARGVRYRTGRKRDSSDALIAAAPLVRPAGADPARAAPTRPDCGEAIARLGNVTLLERPTSRAHAGQRRAHRAAGARAAVPDPRAPARNAGGTRSALRDGDRRKDEFLAMLAHELRNPLAPIRNALAADALSVGRRRQATRPGARR